MVLDLKFTVILERLTIFFMCRVNGHDGSAGLLLKAFGRDIVNVCDSKGRWVATVEDIGFVKKNKKRHLATFWCLRFFFS